MVATITIFILKSIQEWGFIVRKQQNLFLHVFEQRIRKIKN